MWYSACIILISVPSIQRCMSLRGGGNWLAEYVFTLTLFNHLKLYLTIKTNTVTIQCLPPLSIYKSSESISNSNNKRFRFLQQCNNLYYLALSIFMDAKLIIQLRCNITLTNSVYFQSASTLFSSMFYMLDRHYLPIACKSSKYSGHNHSW